MLTIYLVRHGQTEWNLTGRMQGWENSDLTPSGINDALALGKRLKDTPIDCIYTSTSERAAYTAELIAGKRVIPLIKSELLREMSFGDWEGRHKEEIEAEYPNEYKSFWETPHLYQRNSGESYPQILERAAVSYKKITEAHPTGTVLIVSHSLFIRAFMASIKNLSLSQLYSQPYIGNVSLTKIIINQHKPEIIFEGDTTHCLNGLT